MMQLTFLLRKYKTIPRVQAVLGALSVFTLLLIALTPFSRPQITGVNLAQGDKLHAGLLTQQVMIHFSRPMNQAQTERVVHISPEVKTNTSWANDTLFFSFATSLKTDQKYTVTITPQAIDTYGRHLANNVVFQFQTQKAQFVYQDNQDQLELGDLGGQTHPITQHKVIKAFEVNQAAQEVVYLNQPSDQASTEIYLYHLNSGQTERIAPQLSGQIITAQLNRDGTQLFFLLNTQLPKPIFDQNGNEQDFASTVYQYNLKTKQLTVSNLMKVFPNLEYFWVASDGNTFLVNDMNGQYYLHSMLSNSTITVGKFSEYRGGTKRGDRLLFVDSSPQYNYVQGVVLYNGEPHRITDPKENAATPDISQDGSYIAYSFIPKNLVGVDGQKGIRVIAWPDQTQVVNIFDPAVSLELGKISPDNQYLAVEQYTQDQLRDLVHLRKYGEPNKPESAVLRFIDLTTGHELPLSLPGKQLQWVE